MGLEVGDVDLHASAFYTLFAVQRALCASVIAAVLLSVLAVAPRPLEKQPSPDAQEVADATRQLVSGNGYVTSVHGRPQPPRYSPGFSLALAPFALIGDDYPHNVQRGATFYAALYVLIAAVAAWSLGGPLAGAIAAILIGLSPFARVEASLIMSDALAAGMTVLLVPLIREPTPRRIAVAGLFAGALVAVRMPSALALVALLLILPWAHRLRLLLFAAPPLAALAVFQWRTFGSPFRSGYDYWFPETRFFAPAFAVDAGIIRDGPWIAGDLLRGLLLRWMCPCPIGGPEAALPNALFYPAVLAGLFWIFVPTLVPLAGALYAWRHRGETVVRFTFWLTALSLLLFTFYFYQANRFLAAPMTLLGVLASCWLAERFTRAASPAEESRSHPSPSERWPPSASGS